MAALSAPSRNPFRSNPSTPNVTGNSNTDGLAETSPPPTFSTETTPPPGIHAEESRIPERNLGIDVPMEEPPPYTLRPSAMTGETTIEQGPRRPFQPAPSPQPAQVQHTISPQTGNSSYSSLGSRRERPGLLQQLTSSLNSVVDSLNERSYSSGASGAQSRWSSYPGQSPQPQQYAPPPHPPPSTLAVPPPPRHPSSAPLAPRAQSPPTSPTPSSDFARDFYAAGPADDILRNEGAYTPPPGPPPSQPPIPDLPGRPSRAPGSSQQPVPDDGKPTTHPVIGHPLLKDGKILVYPKRYECDKCHNIGYKNSDPLRPCKNCWKKYAKPFSGPLVYSFSNTMPDTKFQRPLLSVPPPAPPPIPPAFSLSPPPAHFAPGGYMTNHYGGFYSPPTGVHPTGMSRPPPGAIVYTAGDPRIGGRLCWRCEGKGNTSFLLLDRITCEVCGGIGRTFN